MNEIVITVSQKVTKELIAHMIMLIRLANEVSKDSTYAKINKSKEALFEAKGMYRVLKSQQMLKEKELIGSDIERIEEKIQNVYEEKRRKEMPKWRRF